MAKINNSYSIRVGYDRVEQVQEGISRDGLEGDCRCASSGNLNVSTDECMLWLVIYYLSTGST